MKTQNLRSLKICFFIYVVFYCAGPFLFFKKAPFETFGAVYPIENLMNTLLFIFAFFLLGWMGLDFQKNEKVFGKVPRFKVISEAMITTGAIFLLSAVFKAIDFFFNINDAAYKVIFPSGSFLKILNCVIGTFLVAFREEFIYRLYLPFQIFDFLGKKAEKKLVQWAVEAFCVLLFAFSHLNLGWLNTIFAICSGIILRRGFLKTNNIFLMTAIHGIYNLMVIIVSTI